MNQKKILLYSLIFIIPFLINTVQAQEVTTITTIIGDSYINQNNPNTNYGTENNLTILNDAGKSKRILTNISLANVPDNVIIFNAEYCMYLHENGTTNKTYLYEVNESWDENTVTWNNQPTYNTTLITTLNTSITGWKCWNVTQLIQNCYCTGNETISFLIRTSGTGSLTEDVFYSKEATNYTPILNVTHSVLTNLSLIYDQFFVLNDTNLMQINYTQLSNGSIVPNATCNITFNGDSGIASYNNSTNLYEIYIIPEDSGLLNLTVNCTAYEYESQYQTAIAYAYFISGTPYNITIGLFENLNATTPYIDEFANILIKPIDYNCTELTGYEKCWLISEYNSGISYFNNTLPVGNFSIYFYSGSVTQICDYCPPYYETITNVKHLGDFYFDNERTELYLYISAFELNWQRELLDWIMTQGISVIAFIIILVSGLVLGVLVFSQSADIKISILTTIVTIIFGIILVEALFGIDVGLSTLINLLLP